MEIKVEIYWEDRNYACAWSYPEFGAIICTEKDIESLKGKFVQSLKSQVEDMVADGEYVPEWLVNGDYEIVYSLEISALLREAEKFTTIAAISRTSGINQKQLHHYASNIKKPRAEQRKRIVESIRSIGQYLMLL